MQYFYNNNLRCTTMCLLCLIEADLLFIGSSSRENEPLLWAVTWAGSNARGLEGGVGDIKTN